MGISQLLCEVRDRDYGGEQKAMAAAWAIHESTLSRWIRRERVPTSAWYDFLQRRLDISLAEVHAACQIERNGVARL
ncbi:hypothetical protein LCGC14_3105520 [marine sediment metagenome]|uniref:HTH cro/C1-type domain-containing protein n=1 Tax=marine sediment metagenome TaxID=412755 RepID=A0A0F8YWL6_9ZZZZ